MLSNERGLAALLAAGGLLLSACGGGSGTGEAPHADPAEVTTAPPPTSPAQAQYQPITSVPEADYLRSTDAPLRFVRSGVFNRINAIRQSIGLGLLAQSHDLDQAAENHARYVGGFGMPIEPVSSHTEDPTQATLFTGVSPLSRVIAAGYVPEKVDESSVIVLNLATQDQVDTQLMASAYNRLPLLGYDWVDVGIGASLSYPLLAIGSLVVEVSYPARATRQGAPAVAYVIWPREGSVTSGVSNAPEYPSPPGAGFPISIQIDPARKLSVARFELREGTAKVPGTVLTAETDVNMRAHGGSAAVFSPTELLRPSTLYTVVFEGKSDDAPLNVSWNFRTP